MQDNMQIWIRIDVEGYTHATFVEWDQDGNERTYTADENFCNATPQMKPHDREVVAVTF
jgi:hypothetical protein